MLSAKWRPFCLGLNVLCFLLFQGLKMGLLTDPKSRERLVAVVSKHNNKLCVLCYAAGICWFLALAYQPFNAQTYFSENALLPGKNSPQGVFLVKKKVILSV